MSNIGSELRQAREQAGVSLDELSARTKIRPSLLDAIERGDAARLPGGLLGRGFVRAYAREVGIDPEPIVQRYQEGLLEPTLDDIARVVDRFGVEPPWWHAQAPAVLVVTLLLGMTTLVVYDRRGAGTGDERDAGSVATTGGELPRAVSAESTRDADDQAGIRSRTSAGVRRDDADRLTIEIHPTGVVWVQARADGVRVLYALVRPGQRNVMDAEREIVLRVGDAGAVEYLINGVPGRSIGGRGQVREVRITPDNYSAFQAR